MIKSKKYKQVVFPLILVATVSFFAGAALAETSSSASTESVEKDADAPKGRLHRKQSDTELNRNRPSRFSEEKQESSAREPASVVASVSVEDVLSEAQGPGICSYCDKHTVTAERFENTNPSALNNLEELRESDSSSPSKGSSRGVN